MATYQAFVGSDEYCMNQQDCRQPAVSTLNYTITNCPGESNPSCRQLNITGHLPSGMSLDSSKHKGDIHVSLPQMPGCIYQNDAWGRIESCDTTANMRGRLHKHLGHHGEMVFTVKGPGHTCSPTINASVNFIAPNVDHFE